MAIFLLAPDFRRLTNLLAWNHGGELADLTRPQFKPGWMRIAAGAVRALRVEEGPAGWKKVAIQSEGNLTVRPSDDKVLNLATKYGKDTLTMNKKDTYRWSKPDGEHVVLEGGGDARTIDASKFLLLSRGFHWINEIAFNK